MRRLMVKEQGRVGLWDIKRVRGGLVEIEFIAQFLQLIHAFQNPAILDTNTHAALTKLAMLASWMGALPMTSRRPACFIIASHRSCAFA